MGPTLQKAMWKTVEAFWLHAPLSSFDRNEWDFAAMAVPMYKNSVKVTTIFMTVVTISESKMTPVE